MVKLAIRCHPGVPVDADELEGWLELEVDGLRADAPNGTIRFSRLTQGLPNVDLSIGWLIELELPAGEPLLGQRRFAEALRDMRLLGLQPTLLSPVEPYEPTPRDDLPVAVLQRVPSQNGRRS